MSASAEWGTFAPSRVIAAAADAQITRGDMMRLLMQRSFTAGVQDPTGNEGYVRGTWDEIEDALGRGLLTDREYAELSAFASRG